MSQALLADKRFHELLLRFDEDLAAGTRAGRCRRCEGVLHSAGYWRKPRGVPAGLPPQYAWRWSFCCAVDGCRKRHIAPSLRYLGGKVYVAAVVVLIAAMRCGVTPFRVRRLQELSGVSRRTVARWRVWWSAVFSASPFWTGAAGQFMPPIAVAELPAALLERFGGDAEQRLLALLRFLLPLSSPR